MNMRSLSAFRISRGIGQYHSNDHFAVLGLPITANATQIRQRYLTIVRRLHPDVYGLSPEEKEVACEYLSKLVSPAYNILMNERERTEYAALIRLIAKRLIKQEQSLQTVSAFATKLLNAQQEFSYEQAVKVVAEHQYESIPKIMAYTSQLSELNLVYLVKSEGYKSPSERSFDISSEATVSNKNGKSKLEQPQTFPCPAQKAEELIAQKQWTAALHELREALKKDNTNARVHALLGVVYLNQKLEGMAKVSFQQALKHNPNEATALSYMAELNDSPNPSKNGAKPTNSDPNLKNKPKDKKDGFFGWLGGS